MPATIYHLVNEQGETTYIGSTVQEPPAMRHAFDPGFEEILTVSVANRFKYEMEAIRTAFEDGHFLKLRWLRCGRWLERRIVSQLIWPALQFKSIYGTEDKMSNFNVYVAYSEDNMRESMVEPQTRRLNSARVIFSAQEASKFCIINCQSKEEMIKTEKELISELNPVYNQTAGGEISGPQRYPGAGSKFKIAPKLIRAMSPSRPQVLILPQLSVYDRQRLA